MLVLGFWWRATRGVVLGLVLCAGVSGALCGPVWASSEGPGWEAIGRFGPTDLPPGGNGVLFLYVYNVGAKAVPGEGPTVVDELPTGLEATGGPTECLGTTEVTCKLGEVAPGGIPHELVIPVRVSASASNASEPVDIVRVSGGGASAAGASRTEVPVVFGSAAAGLGFAVFDGWLSNADGTVDTQAGSHPYELTMAFATNTEGVGGSHEETATYGEPRALNVNLPPGLAGDPGAVPKCPRAVFDGEGCPQSTKIGEDLPSLNGGAVGLYFPIYNLVPPKGVAAQFGFIFDGTSAFLDAGLRSGGDNGITEHIKPVPQEAVVYNTATIWGVPGEHAVPGETREEHERRVGVTPLLTLPTSCGKPQSFGVEELGTWQHPTASAKASFVMRNNAGMAAGFTGCEKLVHFEPSVRVSPDTTYADTPAGLTTVVRVPQGANGSLAVSNIKDTTVVLPEGLVVNPGQANGLQACQASQEAMGLAGDGEVNEEPPSCPAASKVGTDEIATPLLPDRLRGNVYVLQSNPPELELLVAASGDGVNLKLVGKVHLNEMTGQLVTTFEETPDAPFTEFVLSFSGGPQAALATPTACGVYETTAVLTPWSSPFIPNAFSASRFGIDSGPLGAPCVRPLPFAPTMNVSTTDQAAGYTEMLVLLQRGDEQQRISTLQFKAPEGLSGMISRVTLCKEPQAAQGTCPEASQIGHTVVGSGPGPFPLFIPEQGQAPAPIYLTEGYGGAPFGLSIVVPVIAGPFNLGTEVVRGRIEVDPHTAQITVSTNALPTIIKGIPTDLRSIDAVIDRPGFMFNPTNCSPMSFSGTATSTEGATAALSTPFRVGSCQSLKFNPDFKVSTQGKSSKAQGASLSVKIVYPTGNPGHNQASSQANIAAVKVDLPKQLPSRLTTLQKACTAAQFEANPAGCPAASVVGHAKVITPILPVALEGPAYFVSHGDEAFPSLILVLQGYGVTVDLVGTTFISKAGITSSTFKSTPDVPFSTFELNLPEGKDSALATNLPVKDHYDFCGQKLVVPTAFTGQNGAVIHESTPVSVTGCPKAKKVKKARGVRRRSRRGRRRRDEG
jgi:hypothetical protein